MGDIKKIDAIAVNESWDYFIEELTAILTEKVKLARLAKIEAYYEIGQRINEEATVRSFALADVAMDSGISIRELERATQFAKRVPSLGEFMREQNENVSWNKIKSQYLISGKIDECEHPSKITVCSVCRKRL